MTLSAPPHDPSTDELLEVTQTVARGLHTADLDSWCAVDLTMSQLKTLLLARAPRGASHGEIARALGVGVSTVTGVVDRLVEHGLVVRRADTEDRRLSHVIATARGTDLVDQLWGSRRDYLGHLFDLLTPQERIGFHAALEHMVSLISKEQAPIN